LKSKGSKDKKKDCKTTTIDELMHELYKNIQSTEKKSDTVQKKAIEKNKKILVPKVTQAEAATMSSMVEKMEL